MEKIELVVSDFDGTWTDVDKEAKPFTPGYRRDLASEIGISLSELDRLWTPTRRLVRASPSRYGWMVDGKIMAPAYADPYQVAQAVAQVILDQLGLKTDPTERVALLQKLFLKNYELTPTCLREGADKFVTGLKSLADLCVVTNSKPDKVRSKIASLAGDHADVPVYGFARKYVPTPEWDKVSEYVTIEGLERFAYVRRGHYGDLLLQQMSERGLTPEHVLVLGDIHELDTLLPEHLGMRIGLFVKPNTPDFEVQAVNDAGGFVVYSLDEALEEIRRLT